MWGFPTDKAEMVHELVHHLVDKIENNATTMAHTRTHLLEDAEQVLISYGSAARPARHVVDHLRRRGERIGLLELQTLWPFPRQIVRDVARLARFIGVVEMNMGQIAGAVKASVEEPERVFLINRVDGELITDADIKKTLRMIQGRGV
jgi:2-oxoglutarate ferredoxin oxidoreductase subunit alpha